MDLSYFSCILPQTKEHILDIFNERWPFSARAYYCQIRGIQIWASFINLSTSVLFGGPLTTKSEQPGNWKYLSEQTPWFCSFNQKWSWPGIKNYLKHIKWDLKVLLQDRILYTSMPQKISLINSLGLSLTPPPCKETGQLLLDSSRQTSD